MRRTIRTYANDKRLYIIIPKAICELLDLTRGMTIYALVKKKDLILSKKEVAEDDPKWDMVMHRELIQTGANQSLSFIIPQKIVLLLNYYAGQEVDLRLKGNKMLYIVKLYGE